MFKSLKATPLPPFLFIIFAAIGLVTLEVRKGEKQEAGSRVECVYLRRLCTPPASDISWSCDPLAFVQGNVGSSLLIRFALTSFFSQSNISSRRQGHSHLRTPAPAP